jgi:hypothetical protein
MPKKAAAAKPKSSPKKGSRSSARSVKTPEHFTFAESHLTGVAKKGSKSTTTKSTASKGKAKATKGTRKPVSVCCWW